MKLSYKIIIIIFLFYNIQPCFSQTDYRFEHIGHETGIPDAFYIYDIVQDNTGFLWLVGQNKLVKYDGYHMRVYNIKDIDSTLTIGEWLRSIFVDKDNNLWVVTTVGLSLYNREKDSFTNYHLTNDQGVNSSNLSHHIQQDKNGLLWVGTYQNGLYSFDIKTKNVTFYRHDRDDPNSLSTDSLFSIVIDDHNNLWISVNPLNKGLIKFDINNKRFINYKHSVSDINSIGSDNVGYMCKGKSGKIWMSVDSSRIDEFDPATGNFNHYRLGINFNVNSMIEDEQGILWITTGYRSRNIILFDKNKNKHTLISNDPFNSNSITNSSCTLFEDNSGIVWIGTVQAGLSKFVKQKQLFRHYINTSNPVSVRSISGDNKSNIWLGKINGLDKFDPSTGKYTHYSLGIDFNANNIRDEIASMYIDKVGIIWAGTRGGGLKKIELDKNKITRYQKNPDDTNSISSNIVDCIYEDSNGEFWIGSQGGLDKYDRENNSFKHFVDHSCDSAQLGKISVRTINEDKNKTLWFCSGEISKKSGLFRFNRHNESFNHYFNEKLIAGVFDFCEDNKNRFWLCSPLLGLILFNRNTGEAKLYDKSYGLATNFVNNILTDDAGKVWLSSHIGLSCFDPEAEKFRNFNEEDGLKMTDFIFNAAYKDSKGRMYFGGEGGMISFDPDSIITNKNIPNVVLTDFKIFNHSVTPSDNSSLKKHINVAEEIDLDHNDNSFSFEFAALDFNNPKKNQYAYMMEGFDKDWIQSGNVRTANYTNLDPGEYTFRVKGSNNDGVWNETGTSIKVIIAPPWWMTWWFRGLAVMLVISSILMIRHRKLSQIQREMHRQEEFTKELINTQEAERKRIAGELHDSLVQNLLIIKNKALLGIKNPEKNEEAIKDISDLSSSTLQEVRSISHNLHPYQLEQLGLTKAIESIIKNISSIDIKSDIDNIDNIFDPLVEINIYRIIQECMNNILKHSGASKVDLVIKKKEDYVTVNISDNGKGFDQQNLKAGKSFGLRGIYERVKLINGNFNIDSLIGKGTKINITIPYYKSLNS
jgi:signal transduction histidine kinase/ligand-binding sensor domain-containing protein